MGREDDLRRAVPMPLLASDPDIVPLRTVVVMRQEGVRPAAYWYGSKGRALFAEELNGLWKHVEYIFSARGGLFHLMWTEGRPTRVWSESLGSKVSEREEGARTKACVLGIAFPTEEIQRLETVMQEVPYALWTTLITLALEYNSALL